jgi:hypothetical protein
MLPKLNIKKPWQPVCHPSYMLNHLIAFLSFSPGHTAVSKKSIDGGMSTSTDRAKAVCDFLGTVLRAACMLVPVPWQQQQQHVLFLASLRQRSTFFSYTYQPAKELTRVSCIRRDAVASGTC